MLVPEKRWEGDILDGIWKDREKTSTQLMGQIIQESINKRLVIFAKYGHAGL